MKGYVLVTGADRGLGFQLTKQLLKQSYNVFASRYLKDWPWLDELKQKYPEALQIVELDISNGSSVKTAAENIRKVTDSLDIIFNVAGIIDSKDKDITIFEELDYETIHQNMNVNTFGALRVINALIKELLNSSMKLIVNISSEAGSIGANSRTSWFAYCMSKTALNMGSSIIHNSIKDAGGQVLLIHPGYMRTYMSGELNDEADFSPEISAENIMKLVDRREEFRGNNPTFIDHLGNKWPW
jgi:NAD(P)-dependent dehydrogenase (short-subunit alcohol dehydrogenase family)